MGMNPKPEIEDYFSDDYIEYQPFFKDIFLKDRFHQIFWNLHISPPPSGPIGGHLTRSGKVRRGHHVFGQEVQAILCTTT